MVIPYQHTGYNRWYDRAGYPVSAPPWGTLTAMDLNTGERHWQVALGEYEELTEKGNTCHRNRLPYRSRGKPEAYRINLRPGAMHHLIDMG